MVALRRAVHDVRRKIGTAEYLAVLGSSSFWHENSLLTCRHIGRKLAELNSLSIITGGMEGVAEIVARTFLEYLPDTATPPRVFHLLPADFDPVDYGKTIFAGDDVCVRREILGRISRLYLLVEGGPGTEHEAAVAMAQNATLVPVGRSGGCAGELYSQLNKPKFASNGDWQILGCPDASPEAVASAVTQIVKACFLQT